jgi:hypothetical protein
MAKKRRPTLYLVQQVLWQPDEEEIEEDFWEGLDPGDVRWLQCPNSDEGKPVKLFRDAVTAEKFRAEREAEVRAKRNPFCHAKDLEEQTSMPAGVFHDWLVDAGLAPPHPSPRPGADWPAWWDEEMPKMTREQRARVWQALDKVRFFVVVLLETEEA